ncbi:MAG: hypothetical protein J4428_00240 [Candidatus Aenigmarchaeota archaeon]|nr:hypothetical protein [Candidatus Aenigmarchaeota archaeon]
MAVYSSLAREWSDQLAQLLGYCVLDPNDSRIEEDWITGVHYPTLEDLRRWGLMPNETGLSVVPSALENYIRIHGVPVDTKVLERLLYENREE